MKHHASKEFWSRYESLPQDVQNLADKSFSLLREDPAHPSLHFKRIEKFFSVRVGVRYRALGIESPDGVLWFWIGSHAEYDKLLP